MTSGGRPGRAPILGPSFPFRFENGGVARSRGTEKLSQNLRHLLLTRIGERAMRRSLGGGVQSAVNETSEPTLVGLVRHELTRAIATFAPELEIVSEIEVVRVRERLEIAFTYRAALTGGVERFELAVD
ncbi:GPW/gp25 family protein [Roseibium marinum]|uniref:Phage baseplate assembly protein W n=1 Tax=Roseibium marinum TaxID=281252 RepID=A0A2S3UMZ3_9HYPH|nr:GPW/gp25 family protein [Roseibium marinum]POF29082.1 phage baseplate assembly protein W [Roseibium marinum]